MVKHASRSPRQMLCHALEGEVAGMAPHERREQYRRQIQLLHKPMSNLLLAMAVLVRDPDHPLAVLRILCAMLILQQRRRAVT